MAKLTLLIVAHQGGGKGTATTHIKEKHGADSCRFSTPIRAVCDAAGVPQAREDMQKVAAAFRDVYGPDFWEKRILRSCHASDADIMIVDGAREIGDITTLMADPSAFMVYLYADKETRRTRMAGRGENEGEAEMTDEEFERAENHPNEIGICMMVVWVRDNYPDKIVTINNGGEWSDTAETLDRLLPMLLDE